MKKITLHNYEAFLLDFSEGTLNAMEIKNLHSFLALHPELEIDLNDLSFPVLTETIVKAEFKDGLKRTSPFLSEEDLLNYLEGNITPSQKIEFEAIFAANTDLAKELEKYQKTIFNPDTTLIYSEKSLLLKNEEAFLLSTLAIAYLENEVTSAERLDFENELSTSSETKKDFELLTKTVLVPDLTIYFENKASLRKQTKLFFLFDKRVLGSMAAAMLLLWGLIFVLTTFIKSDMEPTPLGSNKKNDNRTPFKTLLKMSDRANKETEAFIPSNNFKNSEPETFVEKKNPFNEQNTKESGIGEQSVLQETVEQQIMDQKNTDENSEEIDSKSMDIQSVNSAAIAKAIESELKQLTNLEEVIDEEEVPVETNPKNQIWKRAVKVAKQVNNLGLRSINGAESSNDQYLLSFNSFSIEKK